MRRVAICCLLALVVGASAVALQSGRFDAVRDALVDRAPTTRAVVATDVLNVRSAPSADASILGALPEGASVEVLGGPTDGFVKVRYGNGTGWMAGSFLESDGFALADVLEPVAPVEVMAAEAPAPVTGFHPAPTEHSAGSETDGTWTTRPAEVPEPAERWIDIDRSSATVTLYDGDLATASFTGRIGRDPASDGFYSTAVGTYHVYSMNRGLAPTPFAEDTWLTHWVGFDPERSNGIHSPVRNADGTVREWQNPSTLGCVRLDAAAAVTVFEFAEIGMRVKVHE
jgi:uncharacterized protein YraI